jgi:hypothetical protein
VAYKSGGGIRLQKGAPTSRRLNGDVVRMVGYSEEKQILISTDEREGLDSYASPRQLGASRILPEAK